MKFHRKRKQVRKLKPSKKGVPPQDPEELTATQKGRLDTIQTVLRIHIDGKWEEEGIGAVFDRLERLLFVDLSEGKGVP